MNASYICENLKALLKNKKNLKAVVHSVFDNALNLSADKYFITLLNKGKNISPMSILVENNIGFNFRGLNIRQDFIFQFTEEYVKCTNNGLYINLAASKVWSPNIVPLNQKISIEQLNNNIKTLEDGLMHFGKLQGSGAILTMLSKEMPELQIANIHCREDVQSKFITGALVVFLNTLIHNNLDHISKAASAIIGFGIGLTPTMDDILNGMMLIIRYAAMSTHGNLEELNLMYNEILKFAEGRTTRVSHEMLIHAASGRTNEAIKKLLEAIFYGSEAAVTTSLIHTIEYGETSGTDTSIGIYIGIKIWQYKRRMAK